MTVPRQMNGLDYIKRARGRGNHGGGASYDPDLASYAPAGLNFDFEKYPIKGQKVNGLWRVDTDPTTLVDSSIWNGVVYYVWPGTGNNTNNGLSYATALNTIDKALELGNATGAPYIVLVRGFGNPTYTRAQAAIVAATRTPTQPCAIISDGGRATVGTHDALTWTLASGTTYQATRSAVQRVRALGGAEMVKVADKAAVDATPGSWAQVSTLVYVNRLDGAAVTNANTRIYVTSDCFNFGTNVSTDVYLKGFNLEGGNLGTVVMSGGTRNLVMDDVGLSFSGSIAAQANGLRHLNASGLCAAFRCSANDHLQDGFNGTWNIGGTPAGYYLTVDCEGKNNGYADSNDNGLTLHDGLIGIDINGDYEGNKGPDVAIAGAATQMWCAGTKAKGSTGTPPNASEYISDAGTLWLEDTVAETAGTAIAAANNATIYTRNHQTVGGGTNSIQVGSTLAEF